LLLLDRCNTIQGLSSCQNLKKKGPGVPFLFSATLLLSATLMFIVEPLFAKKVLPLLGGSPSVWNTCLVFYQAALLAGYLYAHWSLKWLGVRRQAMLHVALLCLPWLVLALPLSVPPLSLPAGWSPPRDSNPVPWLWIVLTARLGLPFVILAATAPMLQAWFADTGHRSSKDPYFLYAASNLGSMLGLAAYPLLIEPNLTLTNQGWWWAGGYGLLMALVTGCAMWLWMSRQSRAAILAASECAAIVQAAERHELPFARRLRWLVLALVPSSLLMGVTLHISTDVSPMPMLWVIPLGLYLLSFVLVFARWRILPHRWMVAIQAVLLVLTAGLFYLGNPESSSQTAGSAVLHLLAFFATAMVCHGELADDRPATCHLTEFYLWMSLGGVLGGLLNALVAPAIFNSVLEYPLMLVAACLLRPRPKDQSAGNSLKWSTALIVFATLVLYCVNDNMHWDAMAGNWSQQWDLAPDSGIARFWHTLGSFGDTYKLALAGMALLPALILGMLAATVLAWCRTVRMRRACKEAGTGSLPIGENAAKTVSSEPPAPLSSTHVTPLEITLGVLMVAVLAAALYFIDREGLASDAMLAEAIGLGMLATFGLARRPWLFALSLAMLLGTSFVCAREQPAVYSARSFFGVLRVRLNEFRRQQSHSLLHGSTLHGTQSRDPEDAQQPGTYYAWEGPVGDIFYELGERYASAGRPGFRAGGRIGVVGLGTGTIAAYGEPGQQITYFEIDPAVKQIAEDPSLFTYLSDARSRGVGVEVVLGDARLTLADVPEGEFDVLLLDAFSSDAIPVHLLTREAIQLYVSRLAPRGLLAVHISNRHLELEPVLGNLADDPRLGLAARVREDNARDGWTRSASTWVVLARRESDLGGLVEVAGLEKDWAWVPLNRDPQQHPWTDDFSNILSVIDWREMDWDWLPGWKLWQHFQPKKLP
jgi:hypothetical protein